MSSHVYFLSRKRKREAKKEEDSILPPAASTECDTHQNTNEVNEDAV